VRVEGVSFGEEEEGAIPRISERWVDDWAASRLAAMAFARCLERGYGV